MITYTILKQGIGVIDSPMPEETKDKLLVKIRDAEGEAVKLVGEDRISYAKVHNNLAAFERSDLKGKINLSLVRASGVVPLGGFICVPGEESTLLYQDAETMLDRLARVERDISEAHTMYNAMMAKYDDITKRLDRLFTGYDFN